MQAKCAKATWLANWSILGRIAAVSWLASSDATRPALHEGGLIGELNKHILGLTVNDWHFLGASINIIPQSIDNI